MFSKAKIAKKNALDNAKSKLEEYEKKLNKNLEIIKKEKIGKEITDERQALLNKLKALEEEKSQLDNKLKKFKDSNPAEYERMKKSIIVCKPKLDYFMMKYYCTLNVFQCYVIQVAKEAGNRWTDNIFSVKSWCKKKFYIEDSVINKQFEIPEDLDYLE